MSTDRYLTVARKAASKFRNVWWVESEELIQEIVAALLAQAESADLDEKPDGYLWQIAIAAAGALVRGYSAPVTVSWRRRGDLAHYHRAELPETLEAAAPGPEAVVGEARWRRKVSQRVGELLAAIKGYPLGKRVVVEGKKPAELAAANGVTVTSVYNEAAQVKRRLAADCLLEELWKEIAA